MQPPFDLNLLKTPLPHEQRELYVKAEHARQIKNSDAAIHALISGWRNSVSAWVVVKLRAVERAVG
ncbi:hypothetical protein [Ruegeria arenilitoris]|uniref:hypothetical protein n=1 Tax=Ruegeria arenilitoris TaxID=1173585 RepID=UPI00147A1FE3|nr:hypothetical protein [Ruegeria arenilitoris]